MKAKKPISRAWITLLIVLAMCLCSIPANAVGEGELIAYADLEETSEYGNVELYTDKPLLPDELAEAGIEYGDIVEVSFLDQTIEMPVVRAYNETATGSTMIRLADDAVVIAINMGDFATKYIADKTSFEDGSFFWEYKEGVEEPVEFRITLKEKGGFFAEGSQEELTYTDERSDYPNLNNDEFANFRAVATTGMGADILYRTSSPINSEHNRSAYADAALQKAGVATVMNLADSEAGAEGYAGYGDTYYSTVNSLELDMGVDFGSEDFKTELADGLRFFAENEGPYAISCKEGKDRTGTVAAVLECFMGATYNEVVSDYMTSFYNYYGVEADGEQYYEIADNNIVTTLETMFDVDELEAADLSAEAEEYFKEIGLSDDEIASLRDNLSVSQSAPASDVEPAPTPEPAPETETAPEAVESETTVNASSEAIDIQFLLLLQNIRKLTGGAFDEIFNGLSKFAVDLMPFMPFFVFWCVDKKWGYRFLATLGIGEIVNGVLKLTVCAYRPWIRSDLVEPAGDSKVAATGYSFPSGHTMSCTSTYGTTIAWQRKRHKGVAVLCGILIALTAFSRNFLGVHTPQDVIVGFTEAVIIILLVGAAQKKINGNNIVLDLLSVLGIAATVGVLYYITTKSYPMDYINGELLVDPAKMMNDSFKACGAFMGFLLGSFIERRFIRYEIPTGSKALPMLGFVGFLITYAWKELLAPATIVAHFGGHWGNFVSRFILWFFVMVIWPLCIRKMAKKTDSAESDVAAE